MYYGDSMAALSSVLRSCIISSEGKELFVADYNAIEARMAFWLADHTKGIEAFALGHDLYKEMAAKIYRKKIEDVTEAERQLGKTAILGCQYGMGPTKFHLTCNNAGIVIDEKLADLAVKIYRDVHSPIVQVWNDTERAAIAAVKSIGLKSYSAGKVKWFMEGEFLYAELPSKRRIAYYKPVIKFVATPWGEKRAALHHMAVDPLTKSWWEVKANRGLLFENCTQAISRDIMMYASLEIEKAGYKILLSVHDELISEKEIGRGSLQEYIDLLCKLPAWAKGLPLKASGWVGTRYKKG